MVHGAGGDERFADADGQTGDGPRVKGVGQELKVSLQTLSTNSKISSQFYWIEDTHRHIMLPWYLADLSRGESDEVDLALVCAGGQSLL